MASISAAPSATEAVKSRKIMASDPTASDTSINPTVDDGTEQNISYSAERIIGNGSFGVVFEAKVVETNEVVAIKKVLQDKRFKNRELQIMRQLVNDAHTNIVALKHCFYSQVRFNRIVVVLFICYIFLLSGYLQKPLSLSVLSSG